MKLTLDTENRSLISEDASGVRQMPLYSPEAFQVLSDWWVRVGWVEKYCYTFTWLGRPIIQLPEDMIRIQEVIWRVQPDVIVETGVAHGGSLIFYASLCKALGKGRVIGIDIEIRKHNRAAIESHDLASYITLLEGSSTDPAMADRLASLIGPHEKVLVVLDSCHSREHVLNELRLYGPLVTAGSYIVATDGVMEGVAGMPRTRDDWAWDNPRQAALEFSRERPGFVVEEPPLLFNESGLSGAATTHWPTAFLKRVA